MIFEEDIEKRDYLEVILTPDDYDNLFDHGIIKEFAFGLYGKRDLNVYIRIDKTYKDKPKVFMPLKKGAEARTKKGFADNVKAEMKAGKPQKQSVAIAYSEANETKRPMKKAIMNKDKK